MVTDLAEVHRLGTGKADENLAFRRYLSAHHTSDAQFQIIASEVEKRIDCTACANCCVHSVVAVGVDDIARIAGYLKITPLEVEQHYTVADPDSPGKRILASTKEGCVYLDDRLCLVYEARPRPCREFPHIGVGTHTLGGRRASHDRWAPLCPIIYNALEQYKHATGFHENR